MLRQGSRGAETGKTNCWLNIAQVKAHWLHYKIKGIFKCRELKFPTCPCHSSRQSFVISDRYNSLSSFGLDIFPKFFSLKINMCSNIKSLSVWEGHELVILALEIKECLNFADSPTRGFLAPNLTLLKVHDCLRLKSLPENMDTLLPSLQILDIANYQQVYSFPEGLPTNMNCLVIDAFEKFIANRK